MGCSANIGLTMAISTWVKSAWNRQSCRLLASASVTRGTVLDISQTLQVSQLRERHLQILIPARKAVRDLVTPVASSPLLRFLTWSLPKQLGGNDSTSVHPPIVPHRSIDLSAVVFFDSSLIRYEVRSTLECTPYAGRLEGWGSVRIRFEGK